MTDNTRLNKRLRGVAGFRGAQPADWATPGKNLLAPGESVILNYSTLDDPRGGTHWVAARRDGNRLVWFDSFGTRFMQDGQPAPDADADELKVHTTFTDWLNSHNLPIDISTEEYQDHHDATCGAWAAAFVEQGTPRETSSFWRRVLALKTPAERDRLIIKSYGDLLDKKAVEAVKSATAL